MSALLLWIARAKAFFAREFARGVPTDAERERRFDERGGW